MDGWFLFALVLCFDSTSLPFFSIFLTYVVVFFSSLVCLRLKFLSFSSNRCSGLYARKRERKRWNEKVSRTIKAIRQKWVHAVRAVPSLSFTYAFSTFFSRMCVWFKILKRQFSGDDFRFGLLCFGSFVHSMCVESTHERTCLRYVHFQHWGLASYAVHSYSLVDERKPYRLDVFYSESLRSFGFGSIKYY